MTIVGYILLAVGLVAAFGNMTGGGSYRPQGANARLVFALVVAALGGYLAFGR